MINKFIEWHKDKINNTANNFGLSKYQLLWISAAKGVVVGYIIGRYL